MAGKTRTRTRTPLPGDLRIIADIKAALVSVGRIVPWRAVCFQHGLAAHLMLGRRGLPSTLHYGAASDANGALVAHVWVDCDGFDVIGNEEAENFHLLASFPPIQSADLVKKIG